MTSYDEWLMMKPRVVELLNITSSRSEIARLLNEEFGTNLTRSSVSGKIYRWGLIPPRPKPQPHPKRPLSKIEVSSSQGKNLFALKDFGECHYPLNGTDSAGFKLYCGAPCHPTGLQYCTSHIMHFNGKGRTPKPWKE